MAREYLLGGNNRERMRVSLLSNFNLQIHLTATYDSVLISLFVMF